MSHSRLRSLSDGQLESAAEVFAVLSDPVRLNVILLLMDQSLPLAAIASAITAPEEIVAGHLLIMQRTGIVEVIVSSGEMLHTVSDGVAVEMVKVMLFHQHRWSD